MGEMRDILIGTAGHIDHGKTTLVKALTGIDADRLQEEKRRGITIDIGFAWMNLGDFRIGFVDVPGHEKFVKNMLAGVGGIQFVLLVVAADESVMPQTVEHFRICQLLEIPRGMVVLTKSGTADPDLVGLVQEEVRDMLAGSFLENSRIVAVDSVQGSGIEILKRTLLEELQGLPGLDARRRIFRMPIDRVFSSRGFGTVVTGTPLAGTIRKNDSLEAYPERKIGKVRSIQVFGETEDQATAGQRTALNLVGLERADLQRGMILGPPGILQPSQILDVSLRVIPGAPAPVCHRDPVRFHHGSAEIMGRIYLFSRKELTPGQRGLGQLRLDRPAQICCLDHFVVRRYSPMTTIAGGIVLDSNASKHRKKELPDLLPELQGLEQAWLEGSPECEGLALRHQISQAGAAGLSLGDLTARMGLNREAIMDLLSRSEAQVLAGQERIVSRSELEALQERTLAFLEDFHSQQPLQTGVSQEELKNRVMPGVSNGVAQHVLESLSAASQIVSQEGLVRTSDWEVRLSPRQQEIRKEILGAFRPQALATPHLSSILERLKFPEDETRSVYFYLVQSGELVRVSGDILLSQDQLQWMLQQIRNSYRTGDSFGVAEFKELFGISRKFAIPYLEFLDRRRITRRVGDQRLVL